MAPVPGRHRSCRRSALLLPASCYQRRPSPPSASPQTVQAPVRNSTISLAFTATSESRPGSPAARATLRPPAPKALVAALTNLNTAQPVDPVADLTVIRAAAVHTPDVLAPAVRGGGGAGGCDRRQAGAGHAGRGTAGV